ncbi:hypothetical protein A2U01_0011834, partial [Trifolium medium]|nr:hypothetical protein [Trifolium medium]
NQLVVIPALTETDGPDSLGWSGTNTHQFMVQNTYNLRRGYYLSIDGELEKCEQTHLNGWPQQQDNVFIGWKQPQEGWIKLNCDGAKVQLTFQGVAIFFETTMVYVE